MINITNIIDQKKCYEEIRKIRWEDGVYCPRCESFETKKVALILKINTNNTTNVKLVKRSLMT